MREMIFGPDIRFFDDIHRLWREKNRNKRVRLKLIKGIEVLICEFCGEEITKMGGQDKDSLAMHHKDGDPGNNERENISFFHLGHHVSHHHKQRRLSLLVESA